MKQPVCLIGLGEMGGVFARGFLRAGYPVYPVVRGADFKKIHEEVPAAEAVVVAVRENDLTEALQTVPPSWKEKLVLLQNELLPRDWKSQGVPHPTVISVWFEKKHPFDYKVIIPSPVFGPKSVLVHEALLSIKIPCRILKSEEELLFELVLKNLYILTINIAGIRAGGTVRELWMNHQPLARAVADDILDIQFHLTGKNLDRERLIEGMVKAFEGDWNHKCLGRTAQERLQRALQQSNEAGLEAKTLKEISALLASSAPGQ